MTRYDPTDIRAQERHAQEKAQREQLAKQNEGEDVKWLMKHKQGRRLVWRMLERAGMYRSSFTGNSETFFREGERNFGIWITLLIHEHCPEQYQVMVAENKPAPEKKEK